MTLALTHVSDELTFNGYEVRNNFIRALISEKNVNF